MSIFNIKIAASAQVTQAVAQMQALDASAQSLANSMKQAALASQGVNPAGYAKATAALKANSVAARNAAMSTGMWEAEQLKLTSAADDFNKRLAAQKVGVKSLWKENKLANLAYREQLKMQQMIVRSAGKVQGKELFDVYTPTELHKELDTASQRLGFFGKRLESATHQMVNWGKNTQWAGRQLTVGLTMPMAAFGAAAGVMAYKIEDELSRIQKVYDTTAQAIAGDTASMAAVDKELAQVREDAMNTASKAAKEYAAAAEDTLNVQAELAATGLKGVELQKQTNEVMRISTLGEIDRQVATDMAISLQSTFRMSNEELAQSFNYLNAIENATSLSTKDFAAAIPIAAAPIKSFGGDIQELGVLLTAMREKGIAATQGANAIKASMQRLGRPSKQIREEFQALTGESITQLVKESDSLSEVFTKLFHITKDMSDYDKRQVFAGLFGTYQVTRMMALTEGMGELEQGIGQVSRASEIAGGDMTKWADTAQMELDRMMKSPSKQFKSALEDLKIQMAEFGEPFLIIGANIMKVLSGILNFINDLPTGMKVVGGLALALMAIAGPVIMLVGLFANLAGNIGKFGVSAIQALTKFELLNKESAAAKVAAKMSESGFISTGTAAQDLAMKLDRLAQAYEKVNLATAKSLGQTAGKTGGYAVPGVPLVGGGASSPVGGGAATPAKPAVNPAGWIIPLTEVEDKQKRILGQSNKIERSWKSTGKLMGIASVAMLAGSVSSSEGADNVASMAMNAALAASALSMFDIKMPKINAGAAKGAGLWKLISGLASKFGKILTSIPRAIMWIVRALGPVGWAVAAITGGFFAIKDALGQAEEDQKKLNKAASAWSKHLGYAKKDWGDIGKITQGVSADIQTISDKAAQLRNSNPEIIEGYTEQKTEAGRNEFAQRQYLTMRLTGASEAAALEGINQLFIASGDSIEEANKKMLNFNKNVKGLEKMDRGGKALASINKELGILANQKWLQEDASDMGFERFQYKRLWKDPKRLLDSIFHDEEAQAYESGVGLANELYAGMSSAKNPFAKANFLLKTADQFSARWTDMLKDINEETKQSLSDQGIDFKDVEKMKEVISAAGDMGYAEFMEKYNLSYNDWMRLSGLAGDEAKTLIAAEKGITEEVRKRTGAEGDATTLKELQADNAGKVLGITKEQAWTQYEAALHGKRMLEWSEGNLKSNEDLTRKQKLQILNIERQRYGLEKTKRLADGFGPATREWANEQDTVNEKLERARKIAAGITNESLQNAVKDSFSSWQQAVADATLADFDRRQDAAMEGLAASGEAQLEGFDKNAEAQTERMEARHDRAMEAMELRAEKATARLERKQEERRKRIEAGFDLRIKRIQDEIEAEQKAEDIRQRIFDAEMQRLDRLNQMANRNIDFNVALNSGDLDEAAKIRNDMDATASEWALADAQGAGTARGEARIGRLEDRTEHVEEARDKRLDALSKVEEAEKKSLDRRLEREKKFLEKRQEAEREFRQEQQERNREALERNIEATRKAEERKWNSRRKYLEKSLDDFTGYIATSTKDLRRHIKIWEKEHKGLSLTTKGQFNRTSDAINKYIKTSVTKAGKQIVNDVDWEVNGWKIAKKMIKGAFGMTPDQFRDFITTGKPPKNWDESNAKKPKGSLDGVSPYKGGKAPKSIFPQYRHEGGEIGTGGGSRKGYARTSKIHPNEVPVIAEKGEFMVNKHAAAKNKAILESINSGTGKNLTKRTGRDGVGGAGDAGANLGIASAFGAMLYATMRRSMEQAILNRGTEAVQKYAAEQAGYSAGKAGLYADVEFSKKQLSHAATIANVGKQMGMSARDIQIGIMTAITESMLSLPTQAQSDRDSGGLFQQRPSQGWGTVAQVMDPEYASRKFFSVLKALKGRGDMTPWMAAQSVQRSAYADGSNYKQYWDEAQAIFGSLGTNGTNYAPGKGGWQKPAPGGLGWSNTHDYRAPLRTPLYAASDGTIIESRAITSGGSPGNGLYGGKYRSYGETVVLRTASGDALRYAHLSPGTRIGLGPVKGGTMIGRSGNTGNSSGPHLHMDVNGNYDAMGWLRKHGIGLKTGGYTMSDGLANLHKNEVVISPERTAKLYEGIDNFAKGTKNEYNVKVEVNSPNASADDIARKVIITLRREEMRKPQSRGK